MRNMNTSVVFHKAFVNKHFAVAKVFTSRGKFYTTN